MATALTSISPIEQELSITLPQADIETAVNQELKKLKSSVQIKGFRKGKTPMSFIKRHYGAETRMRTIYQLADDELQKAIEPMADQLLYEPAMKSSNIAELEHSKEDLEMVFVLPLVSEMKLQGLDENNSYDFHKMVPDQEDIDEAIKNMLDRMGSSEEVDDVQEKDIIEVDAQELDGDSVKENGVQSTFKFAQDLVTDDAVKDSLIGKKVGDRIQFDINTIESGRPEDYIRRYMLHLTEDDADVTYNAQFEGEILSVTRHVPAEINDEFFKTHFEFDEEVQSEASLRDYISSQISDQYMGMANDLLLKDFTDRYYGQEEVQVHEKFYEAKRILREDVEDRDGLMKELRKSTLQGVLTHRFQLQPSEEDVRLEIKNQLLRSQYGYGLDEATVKGFVDNMMENKGYVERTNQQIYLRRLVEGIKNHCTLETLEISKDDITAKHEAAFPKEEQEEE